MGNLVKAKVTIVGTRPLMWHAFGPEAMPADGNRKERQGVAGNDPSEWEKTVLLTKDGQLYLRGDYVFGCLRNASAFTKRGRGTLQKYVQATLQVVEDRVLTNRKMPDKLTNDPDEPVYLDVRGVRNPATKGRNVRYRVTSSPGWELTFTLLWDRTIVSQNEMAAILQDASTLVGLGDGRSIGMGRFTVIGFEVDG